MKTETDGRTGERIAELRRENERLRGRLAKAEAVVSAARELTGCLLVSSNHRLSGFLKEPFDKLAGAIEDYDALAATAD